jgi:hypothetical protein
MTNSSHPVSSARPAHSTARRGWSLALAAVVALTPALALGGSAGAQAATAANSATKSYVLLRDFHRGDCTMFHGAKWTLWSDGYATFTGVVTSGDDDDAWLMRVTLLDASGNDIGKITSDSHNDDHSKFVKNLPDSSQQYTWKIERGDTPGYKGPVATFLPQNYAKIKGIHMNGSRC